MPAPVNDDIGSASAITPGVPVSGTMTDATADAFEEGEFGVGVTTVYFKWQNLTGVPKQFTLGAFTADSPALDILQVLVWVVDGAYPADAEELMTTWPLLGETGPGDTQTGVIPDGAYAVVQFKQDDGADGDFGFDTSAEDPIPPAPPASVLTIHLSNLDYSEHVDLSEICLVRKVMPRHNAGRSAAVQVPSGSSVISGTFTDGDRKVRRMKRKILIWDTAAITEANPTGIIFHGRLTNVEWNGDGKSNNVTLTAMQPLWSETGYEADDRAGRYVRDETGNFIDPTFASPITAGDLVRQVLTNSQVVGDEGDPGGEGPLPIDLTTGTFITTGDMSPENNMSWPVCIGDFLRALIDTDQVDIIERPVDPSEGLDPYAMTAISVVDDAGSDKSGTVHYDYWTGLFNAKEARLVEDGSTLCNKLYDYLGPRIDQQHWGGNITPGSPGTTVDPTDSRAAYGQFMQIRIFDANDVENSVRPLFIALWNAEMGLRIEPRDMLFLLPNPDLYGLWLPFGVDWGEGDLIAVNTGGDFGVDIAAVQRVYDYDVEWDRENIRRITRLVVTAGEG